MMESCIRHVWKRRARRRSRAVSAAHARRSDAPLRQRQARPALRVGTRRRQRRFRRHRVRRVQVGDRERTARSSRCAIRAARRSRDATSTRSPKRQNSSARRAWCGSRSRADGVKSSAAEVLRARRTSRQFGPRPERRTATRFCSSRTRARTRYAGRGQDAQRRRRALRAARSEAVRVLLGARISRISRSTRRPGEPMPAHHPFTAPAEGQWELIATSTR